MKKILAIDIDDVLSDSTDALRRVVNDLLSISLSSEDYRSIEADYWGYYEAVWEKFGAADRFSFDAVEAQMVHDQSHVQPIAGAVDAVAMLADEYEVVLVTSRNPRWKTETKRWVDMHFKSLTSELYFVHELSDDKTKGYLCSDLGVSALIDDNPEHCMSAIDVGVDAVLFGEYGWSYSAPKELAKCSGWSEIKDHLANG